MTMGAGRVVYQDLTRIDRSIQSGEFERLEPIASLAQASASSRLHLLGLLSPGGVHSHQSHIEAMVDLVSRTDREVVIHAFLDGRDTPPSSGLQYVQALQDRVASSANISIGSIHGRYFAMDRDRRWDRTLQSLRLLTHGESLYQARTAIEAVEQAYQRGETDEFVAPTKIHHTPCFEDGDDVFFMNFRADRVRQLTNLLLSENTIDGISNLTLPKLNHFVCMTRYEDDIDHATPYAEKVSVVFDAENLTDTWAEVVSKSDKTQLRIAETEKYAHVTYFFSGSQESKWQNESRKLIPSPQVATYDLQPEMSAREVTEELTQAIRSGSYDAIIANYANADMVGHTGKFSAAIQAVEVLDKCLGEVTQAIQDTDSHLVITADHGNVEQMVDERLEQPHTAHTIGLVPCVYVGHRNCKLSSPGGLEDIAPTLLDLMQIAQPAAMTGKTLLRN